MKRHRTGLVKCYDCGEFIPKNPNNLRNHRRVCLGSVAMPERTHADEVFDDTCSDTQQEEERNGDDSDGGVALSESDYQEDNRPLEDEMQQDFGHLTHHLNSRDISFSEGEIQVSLLYAHAVVIDVRACIKHPHPLAHQLVKFVQMAHHGHGMSREHTERLLAYCKASGGGNIHLPDTWKACMQHCTTLIERLQGPRKTYAVDVEIPTHVRELVPTSFLPHSPPLPSPRTPFSHTKNQGRKVSVRWREGNKEGGKEPDTP